MLYETTVDQLVELPGVGSTRAQQFLQLREEAGEGSYSVFATQHWGSRLVDCRHGVVGLKKGILELGKIPEEVPMDTERADVELYAVEFFLKGLGNKRTSLMVMD